MGLRDKLVYHLRMRDSRFGAANQGESFIE